MPLIPQTHACALRKHANNDRPCLILRIKGLQLLL